MFSDVIKEVLEKEITGQPRAINTVVRGVTRVVSGLTPRERSFCVYLLMGPPGTGKTHMARTIARLLRGGPTAVTVGCSPAAGVDAWLTVASQLAPLGARPKVPSSPAVVRIEYLERGPKELALSLANALETGQVALPGGRSIDLGNSLIFITSGLCSREILADSPRMGFAGSIDDEEDPEDRVFDTCLEQSEEHFGRDLLAQLDALVVFRRLEVEHLPQILDNRVERVNEWLLRGGMTCEMSDAARDFLLERGARDLRNGARDLVRAHQKFVEFPLADLLVSGRVQRGGCVHIDRKPAEEHLHFTPRRVFASMPHAGHSVGVREVPVTT